MQAVTTSASNDWRRPTAGRRATAIGLTLLAELLFVLLLLGLHPSALPQADEPADPKLIDLLPPAPRSEAPRKIVPQVRKTAAAKAPVRAARPSPPKHRPPLNKAPSFIPMSSADLAAADISTLGTAGSGSASTAEASAGSGPGEGPGGARLYKAEWQVEPTDGQLAYYVPKGVERGSWAQIACKTVPRFRVENCYTLGESPIGSGLARAMRLASWQFQVRPPNIDGKPLIGSWVRIRIDFGKER